MSSNEDIARGTADRINELLRSEEVSAQTVSFDLRVSPSVVSRWVAGLSTPSARYIVELCAYFNVSADWLLGLSDQRHPAPARPRTEEEADAASGVLEEFAPPPRESRGPRRRGD